MEHGVYAFIDDGELDPHQVKIGPRKLIVARPDTLRPLHYAAEPPRNCVNCGAPHEPVCSYCGTTA